MLAKLERDMVLARDNLKKTYIFTKILPELETSKNIFLSLQPLDKQILKPQNFLMKKKKFNHKPKNQRKQTCTCGVVR